ncbi:MAG TPA: hypothetical protein VF163_01365 [Micromonosporaceae bacterium]
MPGWSLWRDCALRGAGMPVSWLDAFAIDPASATEQQARASSAAAVRRVVREDRFIEAVTWQNPALISNWLGGYAQRLAHGESTLSRRDQREALIAFLAQRYCAKNETIGFFGPVGWAAFDETSKGIEQSGTGRVRRRSLRVEGWAARAIAAAFAANERLGQHLIARRHPAYAVRDGVLHRPARRPIPLTNQEISVWAALTAPMRVADLLAGLDQVPEPVAVVADLQRHGALLVGIPVPHSADPFRAVLAFLDNLGDEPLRAELAGRLAAFSAGLARIGAAAGDPTRLHQAMLATERAFVELVGAPGRRDKPDQRHGRTLVYEDCRRDIDVTIGADVLDPLRRPLGLLLDSARWFVSELAAEVERDLLVRFREAHATGRAVNLGDLVLRSGDVFNGLPGTAVDRVTADFQARWAELIALAEGRPERLDCAQAAPLARALFPAQPVGWAASVQHSPDLMLRVTDDGFQWVLGELHLALNTLENRPFLTQADRPAQLLAATAADFRGGRIVPLYQPEAPEVTSRTYPPLAMDLPDRYTYWSYDRDDGHPDLVPSLPGAGLLVSVEGGQLHARDEHSGFAAPVLEFLGEFLTALAVNRFHLRPPAAHRSRLIFDDVVVGRETWRVALAEAPLIEPTDADYRQRRLRDWLVELGTPRHVFARTKAATKPVLVDRDAPVSLRNLARSLRQAAGTHPQSWIDLVEMLPGPDELWLTDAQGERYTSELRIVAVDERQQPAELGRPGQAQP